jgi:hypothetical protein
MTPLRLASSKSLKNLAATISRIAAASDISYQR